MTQIDGFRDRIAAHWSAIEDLDAKIAEARRLQLAKAVSQMAADPANAWRPRSELIDSAEKALPKEASDSPIDRLQSEREKLAQSDAETISLEHKIAELRNQREVFATSNWRRARFFRRRRRGGAERGKHFSPSPRSFNLPPTIRALTHRLTSCTAIGTIG